MPRKLQDTRRLSLSLPRTHPLQRTGIDSRRSGTTSAHMKPASVHLNIARKRERNLGATYGMRKKVCFFGHFGTDNLGNESTLQAVLYHLRCHSPDAEVSCVCSVPETLASTQGVKTVAISKRILRPWNIRSPVAKLIRKAFVGIPSELYRWLEAFRTLRGTDVFIIPGTGLLTDAYGLSRWGPYNLFKWS